MSTAPLRQAQDVNVLLSSVLKNPDGTPRFLLSLPPRYQSDPGLEVLARLETQRAAGVNYTPVDLIRYARGRRPCQAPSRRARSARARSARIKGRRSVTPA